MRRMLMCMITVTACTMNADFFIYGDVFASRFWWVVWGLEVRLSEDGSVWVRLWLKLGRIAYWKGSHRLWGDVVVFGGGHGECSALPCW